MMSIEAQELVADLADRFIDEAIASGEVFSESLCSWALCKAKAELGL